MRLGRIEANPAKGVRKLAAAPRERRLSRSEIDRLGKTLRAAAEEGEHPTGLAAVGLLLDQPTTKSPFFFPADWGEGHFVGVVRMLDRVCGKAGLTDVTPHTLRHTFASLAGDLGFSELTIAALLGHAARGVTQRYIHIDEALRMTADRVAAEMADVLDGRARVRVRRDNDSEQAVDAVGSES
ncbi:MAG TPA: tyrosine-type recombinase/integrase [Telmatospirillum sp.]|nr:tyrosine-type recombinase/integrase [Telmatospirillum sp.]